jgi:hypothetical protein
MSTHTTRNRVGNLQTLRFFGVNIIVGCPDELGVMISLYILFTLVAIALGNAIQILDLANLGPFWSLSIGRGVYVIVVIRCGIDYNSTFVLNRCQTHENYVLKASIKIMT